MDCSECSLWTTLFHLVPPLKCDHGEPRMFVRTERMATGLLASESQHRSTSFLVAFGSIFNMFIHLSRTKSLIRLVNGHRD